MTTEMIKKIQDLEDTVLEFTVKNIQDLEDNILEDNILEDNILKLEIIQGWSCRSNISDFTFKLPINLLILKLNDLNLSDISCELPSTLITLDISDNNIHIFNYNLLPLGLKQLDMSYNKIKTIGFLPESLIYLDCCSNKIEKINKLPTKLQILDTNNNKIRSIARFPPELIYINCSYNCLEELPPLEHLQLIMFLCNSNKLSILPNINFGNQSLSNNQYEYLYYKKEYILNYYKYYSSYGKVINGDAHYNDFEMCIQINIDHIKYVLNCSHNKLTSLPKLQQIINVLNYGYNNITNIISLPENLVILDCSNNGIVELPTLPNKLDVLLCHNNYITNLNIDNLSYLTVVECQYNFITSISFKNLLVLNISHNYLKSIMHNNTLNDLGLEFLSINNNNIIELNNIIDLKNEEYKYIILYLTTRDSNNYKIINDISINEELEPNYLK
jgi:Leucine-rich repeat (LRR) protein